MTVALAAAVAVQSAQLPRMPPHDLPAAAVQRLADGLAVSRSHKSNVWRDTLP